MQKKENRFHDWDKLKQEFLSGGYKSIRAFAIAKNIPYVSVNNHGRGRKWLEAKRNYQAKIELKTQERATTDIAKENAKHIKEAMLIRDWAHKNLFTVVKDKNGKEKIEYLLEPKTAKEVIDAIKVSVDMVRDTLGLNKQEVNITVNEIKINMQMFIEKVAYVIRREVKDEPTRLKIIKGLDSVFSEESEMEFNRRN